ncbi:hypothetical protein FO519_004333 [Halicephalobus sp. NKZ332]|nr:hypothetical protein FO519_004333 [Halicephalobus sp. NKZ332]
METPKEFQTDWRSIWIANIVAFIGSVQSSSLVPSVWPYLKKVDVRTTETLYGFVRGLFSLAQIIFSIISGFFSNKIENTKPCMIIGKILIVAAIFFYCLIGVYPSQYIYNFVLFEIFFGIASGTASVYRTHVAMASTEDDRTRAYGSTQLCTAIGIVVGPAIQLAFTRIAYPGFELFGGIYLNLYTAPALMAGGISIIGILLMIFLFNGKMRVQNSGRRVRPSEAKKEVSSDFDENKNQIPLKEINLNREDSYLNLQKESDTEENSEKEVPYNMIAILVLIFTKVVGELVMLNLSTIIPPYIMTAFQWSSEEAVKMQSVLMGCVGSLIILFSSAFVFLKLGTKISERFSICVGITTFLIFHLITYPWEFYGGKISYLHEKGHPPPLNLSMALTDNALQQLISDSLYPNSTIEIVGCNLQYTWCENTPQIDFPIFAVCSIISMGLGFPLLTINLDVLYSKVLGPIKQGTLQGVFIGTAQIMNIIGPMIFSKLYTAYGPKILWLIEITVCIADLLLLLIFYRKLVSWDGRKSNSKKPKTGIHLKTKS